MSCLVNMTVVQEYLKIDLECKEKYGNKTFLLYQVGSFFEVYALESTQHTMKNIRIFGEICGLKVEKKKQIVENQEVYMAGFRDYLVESYVEKIHPYGYSVVVYVQEDSPKDPKVKIRTLHGVYSPGTTFLENDTHLSNNISCIWIQKMSTLNKEAYIFGLSNINIYDGTSFLCEYYENYYHNPTTYDCIEKFLHVYNPIEIVFVYNIDDSKMNSIVKFLNVNCKKKYMINLNNNEQTFTKQAINCQNQVYQDEIINTYFPNINLEIFKYNISDKPISLQSYCFLINFVQQHNISLVEKIQEPTIENIQKILICANHSLKQLNFIKNVQEENTSSIYDEDENKNKIDCVLSILNQCVTKMGKRYLNQLLLNPICDVDELNKRYDLIDHIMKKGYIFNENLNYLKDIDKMLTKIKLHKLTPNDIFHFYQSSITFDKIYEKIKKDKKLCKEFDVKKIIENHDKFQNYITTTFNLDKAEYITTINLEKYFEHTCELFQPGNFPDYDEQVKNKLESMNKLDAILDFIETCFTKKSKDTNNTYIKQHQPSGSELCLILTKTRRQNLKNNIDNMIKDGNNIVIINFVSSYDNNVYEFDFDVSNIYFRDYNKTSCLLCSTDIDLLISNIYNMTLTFNKVLQESYTKVINHMIHNFYDHVLTMNYLFKKVDMYNNFVFLSKQYNLCKPKIEHKYGNKDNHDSYINAKKMRHILIENIDKNEIYVPNDVQLGMDKEDSQGILLFGTNAVGKTSLIKSIGICTIMAQSGCYVPCKSFHYFPYKYIFTRIIGNDNIFKGLSTFGVEMSELRVILNQCNNNSLILGDELCSGTEIESALSIFMTSLQIMDERKSSFIFATHFHEIQQMKEMDELNKIKLKHLKVAYNHETDSLVYDRKIQEGAGESIYGLEVCKSLNMPQDFIERCYNIRNNLINNRNNVLLMKVCKYNKNKIKSKCEFCKENMATEIHHLQYQKDANKNNYINDSFHKNHVANLANICEKCHHHLHSLNLVMERRKTINGSYEFVLKKK